MRPVANSPRNKTTKITDTNQRFTRLNFDESKAGKKMSSAVDIHSILSLFVKDNKFFVKTFPITKDPINHKTLIPYVENIYIKSSRILRRVNASNNPYLMNMSTAR